MIIEKIVLENFKIHKNKELEFQDKNLIIGENGTGKSSIFHAIIFALFGDRGKEYLNIYRLSNLIREFSSTAKVKIFLIDRDKKYIVERYISIGEGSNTAIREGNNILATGVEAVRKKLYEILKINKENKILDVLYIPQGELGKYIKLSGTKELTKLLESLFDLDFYTAMLEVVKKVTKDLSEEYTQLSDRIVQKEKDINKFKSIYGEKTIEELEKLAEEYEKLYSEYKNLKEKYSKIRALYDTIDFELIRKKEEIYNKLLEKEKIIKEQEEIIIKLKSEKSGLEYKKIHEDLIKKSLEELEKIKLNLEKKIKDVDKKDLEIKIKELEKMLSIINQYEMLIGIDREYENKNNILKDLDVKIKILQARLDDIRKTIDLLSKKEINKCPVCGKELEEREVNELIKKHNEELNKNEKELRYLQEQYKKLKQEVKDLEYKYNKFNTLINILKENNINLDSLDNEKHNIMRKLVDISEKIKDIEEYDRVKDAINYIKSKNIEESIKLLEENVRKIREEYNNILSLYKKIELMEENLNKVNKILTELGYSNIIDLENKIKSMEIELEKYKGINIREIELYRLHLKELKDLKEKLKKIKYYMNNLIALKTILEKFILQYRKTIAKKLSASFNYYFKKLYRYSDIKEVKCEVKYEREEWKLHIYVKKVIDEKELWKDIKEANLSGGQIKILDLAFRLALAHIIKPNFKVLMLDEPTESLDENMRYALAELLDSLEGYQIILCTHDELFKEKMQGKVFVFSRVL